MLNKCIVLYHRRSVTLKNAKNFSRRRKNVIFHRSVAEKPGFWDASIYRASEKSTFFIQKFSPAALTWKIYPLFAPMAPKFSTFLAIFLVFSSVQKPSKNPVFEKTGLKTPPRTKKF